MPVSIITGHANCFVFKLSPMFQTLACLTYRLSHLFRLKPCTTSFPFHLQTRQPLYVQCNIQVRSQITVAVEEQHVLHISVCVVRAHVCGCPAHEHVNAHACAYPSIYSIQCVCAILCHHLWPLWLHHIFRRYLINSNFRKKGY
jgi:hypothetical protein